MMEKIKSRQEIVEKMEEMYSMGREGILPFQYVIPITDALDWCLGDSNYLETEELKIRGKILKVCEENEGKVQDG